MQGSEELEWRHHYWKLHKILTILQKVKLNFSSPGISFEQLKLYEFVEFSVSFDVTWSRERLHSEAIKKFNEKICKFIEAMKKINWKLLNSSSKTEVSLLELQSFTYFPISPHFSTFLYQKKISLPSNPTLKFSAKVSKKRVWSS